MTPGKVSTLAEVRQVKNYCFDIEVDGAFNRENCRVMLTSGATQAVVGRSGLFGLDPDIEIAWEKMKEYMGECSV
jgi:D-allulose-6-phosphate 3-epimerase